MNSKNALTKLSNMTSPYYWRTKEQIELIKIVEQSLDRLENLEKENQELLVNKNVAQGIATKLKEENDKLKKVLWILKDHLELYLVHQKFDDIEFYSVMSKSLGMCLLNTNKNTYELIKEVFGNDK